MSVYGPPTCDCICCGSPNDGIESCGFEGCDAAVCKKCIDLFFVECHGCGFLVCPSHCEYVQEGLELKRLCEQCRTWMKENGELEDDN